MADSPAPRAIADLIFVGFNSRIVALDRYTGELVWTWRSPKGSGYVAILLDGDRLIASIQGYTYCIDPVFGQQVWMNELEGLGVGTPCIASASGSTATGPMAVDEEARAQQAAVAAS